MTKEVVTTVTVAQYTIGMSITYGPGPHMPMTEPMGNTGLSNFATAGEKNHPRGTIPFWGMSTTGNGP
jgi:hypothetical protein